MKFFSDHRHKKIVILLGHPDTTHTNSSEMALMYETAAKKAGHEVKRFDLGDMRFDPILHRGYKDIQQLEPDLIALQEAIKWADHFVLVYPTWWSGMPALLKGMFDRMWLPSFAFHMRKTLQGSPAVGWKKMMKGKTARVITLTGQHPFFIWCLFGDYTNEIKMAILWFAGFKTRVTCLGPVEYAPEWMRNSWRRKVWRLGELGE
ncbi:MAG: NAD(P)H-dependent oxidoreductase [Patescibacteria group bacterium]